MTERRPRGPEAAWAAGTVARRLGIPRSTLRTWNRRYGLGPPDHEPGRYRLYTEADIAELERMQQLVAEGMPMAAAATAARYHRGAGAGVVDGRVGARPATRPLRSVRGLEAAALRLDAHAVVQALDFSIAARGVLATWHTLCRPLLSRLGRRIADTGDCMDVELMVSWAVTASLHRVSRADPAPTAPRVLLACVAEERHSLVLEVLHAVLAEQGVGTQMLGAAVPTAVLLDAATRTRPAAVVASSHLPRTARVAVLRRLAPLTGHVLAAGPGWNAVTLPGGVTRAETVETAIRSVHDAASVPAPVAP